MGALSYRCKFLREFMYLTQFCIYNVTQLRNTTHGESEIRKKNSYVV